MIFGSINLVQAQSYQESPSISEQNYSSSSASPNAFNEVNTHFAQLGKGNRCKSRAKKEINHEGDPI
ncbi:hypothetical protein BPOR_0356g00030 [Botrytis porri]|uniref:Uncharacterized protein n=1 Tax=Botrytis porri TaxID=87229 RepID=A0A4Z1KK46_9HELO|nr:hypothetical protein BPOR_0356g00030 [Botrytis porri]